MTYEEQLEIEEGLRGWMVGLTMKETAERLGHDNLRALIINGEELIGTMDYDPTRINVAIEGQDLDEDGEDCDYVITQVLKLG
jgi:hypothetical protein